MRISIFAQDYISGKPLKPRFRSRSNSNSSVNEQVSTHISYNSGSDTEPSTPEPSSSSTASFDFMPIATCLSDLPGTPGCRNDNQQCTTESNAEDEDGEHLVGKMRKNIENNDKKANKKAGKQQRDKPGGKSRKKLKDLDKSEEIDSDVCSKLDKDTKAGKKKGKVKKMDKGDGNNSDKIEKRVKDRGGDSKGCKNVVISAKDRKKAMADDSSSDKDKSQHQQHCKESQLSDSGYIVKNSVTSVSGLSSNGGNNSPMAHVKQQVGSAMKTEQIGIADCRIVEKVSGFIYFIFIP